MRFLVDECTGPALAKWLETELHEVYSVYDNSPGMTDEEILLKAYAEEWILITNDKDFGELIFREKKPHHGVILLRLKNERASSKIASMKLLLRHSDKLKDQFVVFKADSMTYSIRFASP